MKFKTKWLFYVLLALTIFSGTGLKAEAANLITYRVPVMTAGTYYYGNTLTTSIINYPDSNYIYIASGTNKSSSINSITDVRNDVTASMSESVNPSSYSTMSSFFSSFSLLKLDLNNAKYYIQENNEDVLDKILNGNVKSAKLQLSVTNTLEHNHTVLVDSNVYPEVRTDGKLPEYQPSQDLYFTNNDSWDDINGYYSDIVTIENTVENEVVNGSDFDFPDVSDEELLASSKYQTGNSIQQWDITDTISQILGNSQNSDGILSFVIENSESPFATIPDGTGNYSSTVELGYDIIYNTANNSYLEVQVEAPTPEPSSIVLGLISLGGLLGFKRRR